MPSLKTTILAAATMLFSAVQADYVIEPDSVSLTLRNYWCKQEMSSCPLICQQVEPRTTDVNTCDAATLTYGCVCGNGLQPNLSQYSLTIPYFTCTEWGTQCVAKCSGDNACSSSCRQDHPCGAQNPAPPNKTASATQSSTGTGSSATPSATDSGTTYNGFAGSGSSGDDNSTDSAAMRALEAGGSLGGFVLLFAGVCAGAGFVL